MSDHTGSVRSGGEGAPLLVLLLVLASLAAADFVLTVTHAIQPLDRQVTEATQRFTPTWLTPTMVGFTLIGEDAPLDVFAAVVAFAALRRGHRLDTALLVTVALLARLIGLVLKNAARQPRPVLLLPPRPLSILHNFGYPSGHALLSIAILGFAAVVISRLLSRSLPCVFVVAPLALLVFCIGWSRVYLGFHWLNDVVGGYLDGAVIVVGALLLNVFLKGDAHTTVGPLA